MKVRVAIDGASHELEVARVGGGHFRVLVGGRALDAALDAVVEPSCDGAIRFRLGGASHRAIGFASKSERYLWVDGVTLRYEIVRGARAPADAHDGGLASPTPGVVAEVLAAPGAAVRKGEKLVVLESMKMFFPIVAPRDGRIARVLCARGETVAAGVPLVEMVDESGTR